MKTNDEVKDDDIKSVRWLTLQKNIHRRDTSYTLDTDFEGEKYMSILTEYLDNARRLATCCCECVK